MKFGLILLAAGTGERFGGNKLIEKIAGKPIIQYILNNLPVCRFDDCVGVVSDPQVEGYIATHDIRTVFNDMPDEGISRSIRLGIKTLRDVDACMFVVADQPMLRGSTIKAMLDVYQQDSILSLSTNGRRGNPVIFPASLLSELLQLKKGEYGTTVINNHKDLLVLHDIDDITQLMDIDTKKNLKDIKAMME